MTTAIGERRRDRGIERASFDHTRQILEGRIALIDVLLASPDGTATTDATVANLAAKHSDGGRWRGAITSGLARQRIIVADGVERSCRPARHAGYLTRWRLLDHSAAVARRSADAAALAAMDAPPNATGPAAATASPAGDQ
jgi:hypothetical protein